MAWYLFGRRAEERGACQPVYMALSFRISFRAILKSRLKAFCRVAPSVLFKVRAIVATRVLLFASFFRARTSFAVQVRRRLFML